MDDIRRRKLDNAVWIPLRAAQSESVGEKGMLGYREDFFGVGSLAIPLDGRREAETLGWMEVGLRQRHKGSVVATRYIPSDAYEHWKLKNPGLPLALEQEGNTIESPEWHLHQDFAITLGLKREDDSWLAINEAYTVVARIKRNANGCPVLLEVRAEYLKDYLCARHMALYVVTYRNREEVVEEATHIDWPNHAGQPFRSGTNEDRWEGRRIAGEEGGLSVAVLQIGREGIDVEEDVPSIGPTDGNIVTKSWKVERRGPKKVTVQGELWRTEWVEPAQASPRVGGDDVASSAFFTVDAAGSRPSADQLKGSGHWLWFRPDVINLLLKNRGGQLNWFTRDTGSVRGTPAPGVAFGVNKLGLVNVYAKDVAERSEWERVLWAGFNITPDGGVSEELLAAQAAGSPADTQAPEACLGRVIAELNMVTVSKFAFALFRAHRDFQALLACVHRFRALDEPGLLSLAKDLARLIADSIEAGSLQKVAPPPKGEKRGSLKSLEGVIALRNGPVDARQLVGPLAGIYALRNEDAHLASSDIEESYRLAGVDRTIPFVLQGHSLLHSCVSTLSKILEVLKTFPDQSSAGSAGK